MSRTTKGSLLDQIRPERPAYYVIDGRHRLAAATVLARPTLRCDVVTSDGNRSLRVLPRDQLALDPDVQFDFAYRDSRARKMAMKWDDRKCDPLLVTMIADRMPLVERADLKVGVDRERRRVSRVESFMAEVQTGDIEAASIHSTIQEFGWTIREGGSSPLILKSVAMLTYQHRIGLLRPMLALNAIWKGDRGANTAEWIGALGLLCRDEYDKHLAQPQLARLREVVPVEIIRKGKGMTFGKPGGHGGSFSEPMYHMAGLLRRKARMQKRPMRRIAEHDRGGGMAREVP